MSLAGLLNQTITIYNASGRNAYGRLSMGSGANTSARFQAHQKRILLPNGEMQTIEATAYVLPSVSVTEGDKVAYNGKNYKVIAKYATPDGDGVTNHLRLELVQWSE